MCKSYCSSDQTKGQFPLQKNEVKGGDQNQIREEEKKSYLLPEIKNPQVISIKSHSEKKRHSFIFSFKKKNNKLLIFDKHY